MQSIMAALIARINKAEERVSDIGDKTVERKAAEEEREKQLMYHKGRIWEISDTIKCNNIRTIGVPEEEERERERQKVYLSKS